MFAAKIANKGKNNKFCAGKMSARKGEKSQE